MPSAEYSQIFFSYVDNNRFVNLNGMTSEYIESEGSSEWLQNSINRHLQQQQFYYQMQNSSFFLPFFPSLNRKELIVFIHIAHE